MYTQCKAFCSAVSYQMKPLYKFFKKNDQATETYGSVIYTPINKGHAFFFPYGCVVFWRLNEDEISQTFKKLKSFEEHHLPKTNEETYHIISGSTTKVHQNEICLGDNNGIMEELAISHALAQSMKLTTFEERVEQTIKKTEHIPKSLAETGKITLSGTEIAKKMGKLFLDRSSINLRSDILDTPEFFWENPKLEPIYHMAAYDQEIKQRVEILNERLKLINELFQILSDVFNNRHASILETIIIVFIAIEIILTILFHIID
jgi:uncharacterized Rmd1/YagE family protein